jgi:hypothetical protein
MLASMSGLSLPRSGARFFHGASKPDPVELLERLGGFATHLLLTGALPVE